MKVQEILPVVALAVMAGGCNGGSGVSSEDFASLRKEMDDLKIWVGWQASVQDTSETNVGEWHQEMYQAICNLEGQVAGLTSGDLLCHDQHFDHGAPPIPPPFPS